MIEMIPNAPVERPMSRGRTIARAIVGLFASVKFAVSVIILIAIACVFGTILPQGADAAAFAHNNPAAAPRMAMFAKLGLTNVYYAWWFLLMLCVLALSVMACTTRRFATMRRTTGAAQRRAFGSMISHISILLIIAGGVVRGVWGEKGYIEIREGETTSHFTVGKLQQPLPFALHLVEFDIETYAEPAATASKPDAAGKSLVVRWIERELAARVSAQVDSVHSLSPQGETPGTDNTFEIRILRYVADFAMDPETREVISRSDEPRNPAILLAVNGPEYENHRWVFARFPNFTMGEDGTHGTARPSPLEYYFDHDGVASAGGISGRIKSFKSTVKVLEDGRMVAGRVIEVNRPFKFNGYTFYQTGYNPDDLSWTSLEVVRDPGVPLVYAGFSLMIVGLFIVFYLNPWLASRKART